MAPSHYFVYVYIVVLCGVYTSALINPSGTDSTIIKGCRPQVDVIFLLDGSDSISDQEFLQQKEFLRRFVELSDVGPESIRVGLAVVSSKIGDELPLSLNATKASFLVALDDISQPQEGSRTDLGLIEMEQLFSTNSRRGVARIGVIITDGRAKYIKATEGESRVVKDAGIFLVAVGVGRLIKFSELEKIASTKSNAYKLEPLDLSTRYLAETVDFLGLESCTGNMMIDKLGIMSDKNSAVVSGSPNSIPETNANNVALPTASMSNSIADPLNALPKHVMDLPAAGLNNIAPPTAVLANKISPLPVSMPENLMNLPSTDLYNMMSLSSGMTKNMISQSIALPNNILDMSASEQSNVIDPPTAINSNNVAESSATGSNVVPLSAAASSNNIVDQSGPLFANKADQLRSLFSNTADQPDTLLSNMANQPGSLLSNMAIQPGSLLRNMADQSGSLLSNMADQQGSLLSNIADQPGSSLSNMANRQGSLLSNKVDQPGSLLSNMANQQGSLLSNMADQQSTLLSNIATQPDSLLSNMATQPGSLLSNMAEQPGSLLSNMATQPGSLLSNIAEQPGSLLSNMATRPDSLLSNMAIQPGSFLSNMATQPGSLLNNMADKPGSSLSNVEDQQGSLLTNMATQPGSLLSNMADQPGSLLSNMANQQSSLLSNMVNQPDSKVSSIVDQPSSLSNTMANQPGSLLGNFADQPSSLLGKMGESSAVGRDVFRPNPPAPKPQPPTDLVIHNTQAKSSQATFETNNAIIKNNNTPKLRNFLGLKMSPFASMGRFSAINAINPGVHSQLTNHPTAPLTESPVVITTQAPITTTSTTTQPIPTAPRFVAQTAAPLNMLHNSLVQYQHNGSSPTETANLMIQNLLVGNAMPRNKVRSTGVEPQLFANTGMFNSAGVSIQNPGTPVGDSLAFLKTDMKPARTVKEVINPIYQMFEESQNTKSPIKQTAVQTMTTTMPADLTSQHRNVALLKAQCSSKHFVNGVAYMLKAGSCTEFVKCYQENGVVNFKEVKCPFETIFDDQQLVCRHYTERRCLNDPCVDQRQTSYSHTGNCRAYWQCTGGLSVPVCCPRGTSYTQGYGCVRNVTCSDTCMDFGDLRTVTMATQCKMLAIEGDKNGYFDNVAGVGWVIRQCAPGTNFEQANCACSSTQETSAEICEPELYLDFQGGIVDKSKNSLSMGIQNVHLDGGAGAFYGQSHLKLWRFSGMSLGQHITISFRFRTSVTAKKGKLMHIVSNCCYGCSGKPKPSLDIALIPASNGGVAVFSTTSAEAGEMFLFLPFRDTFTGWNRLEFTYNGLVMTATVNGQTASKKMMGNIEAKSDPLLIGSCGVQNAYDGFLDEFKFYMCNP